MINLESAGFKKNLTGFTVIPYLLNILVNVYYNFNSNT